MQILGEMADLFKNYRLTTESLQKTISQLSSGSSFASAGDSPVAADQINFLNLERASGIAQMQASQSRLSWHQTAISYLSEIQRILFSMSDLAAKAESNMLTPANRVGVDNNFQQLKQRISSIVDGNGGQMQAARSFKSIPLFLGYSPNVDISSQKTVRGATGTEGTNLYTGYNQQGFSTLPLINAAPPNPPVAPTVSGTASAGSLSTVMLATDASGIDQVYSSLQIAITGGAGSGQIATIASYEGKTGIATFQAPLGTALDHTSQYTITSATPNQVIVAVSSVTSARVAENIWGAENGQPTVQPQVFHPLTQAEITYRTTNAIPNTNLDAHTPEEKLARRQLNIFDPEFSSLTLPENATRMFQQVANAINQISQLESKEAAQAQNLQSQYSLLQQKTTTNADSINAIQGVDYAKAHISLNSLNTAHSLILQLAVQMSVKLGKLNTLIQNKGSLK